MLFPKGNQRVDYIKSRLAEIDDEVAQMASNDPMPSGEYVNALANERAQLRDELQKLRIDR